MCCTQRPLLPPLFFFPVRAAIVSCGGLCPGENDVIQAIVHSLALGYGVPDGKELPPFPPLPHPTPALPPPLLRLPRLTSLFVGAPD